MTGRGTDACPPPRWTDGRDAATARAEAGPLRSRVGDLRTLIRRFWAVVIAGYVAALIVVGFGVWLSAQPFLQQMQRDAVTDRAQGKARVIGALLDDLRAEAETVAETPDILRLVLGVDRSSLAVFDELSALETAGHIRHALLDYRGNPLAMSPGFGLRESRAVFSRAEILAALANRNDALAAGAGDPTTQFRFRGRADAGDYGLLVATPVHVNGAIEGTLVIERQVHLPMLVAADDAGETWQVVSDFQLANLRRWQGLSRAPLSAPIGDTGYHVAMERPGAGLSAQGWDLLQSVLEVVLWGLLLPFLGMAVFGRGVIAKPYEALAASRQKLAHSQREVAELAQIATMSSDAVLMTDSAGRITYANRAFQRLSGYGAAALIGHKPGPLLQGPETDPATIRRISAAIAARQPIRTEILNYRADGSTYWITLSISPLQNVEGVVDRYVGISADITDKKLSERRLQQAQRETEYQARHDALTGLPNRRALDELLEQEIGPDPAPRTMVRVDLDHFKAVNDTHGHAAGDHVLVHVSRILRAEIHETDFAARIGGDEFVLVLGPGRGCAEGIRLTEALLAQIRKDVMFEGKTCRVGSSFGVACSQAGLIANADLLVAADAALYEAKELGRNRTVLYTPAIHAGVQDKRRLAIEIERGIAREEFVPLFQPQLDARTQKVVGAEVLLRWQHPEHGLLAPHAFLGTATKLSMITEIDSIIYRQGLRAAAELERVGHALPKISFNVGAAQIEDPALIAISDLYALDRTKVAFEVLESVLVEEQSSNFRFQIDRLRERGYRIEIDDFGSGHASVVGLMQLNPDAMKIDQRLIIPMTDSARIRDLVKHIIGIGRSFGISVTAEGVETEEHVAILSDLGCNTLQGFHFAPALTVLELLDFIEARGTLCPDAAFADMTEGTA